MSCSRLSVNFTVNREATQRPVEKTCTLFRAALSCLSETCLYNNIVQLPYECALPAS